MEETRTLNTGEQIIVLLWTCFVSTIFIIFPTLFVISLVVSLLLVLALFPHILPARS